MKKFIAILIMLMLIFCAVYIGGYRSLNELRGKAQDVFLDDIQSSLDKVRADSVQLSKITGDPENFRELIENLVSAETPAEKHYACFALINYITSLELTATASDAISFQNRIIESASLIDAERYNNAVTDFNSAIDSIPTKYIAVLVGIKKLEKYN